MGTDHTAHPTTWAPRSTLISETEGQFGQTTSSFFDVFGLHWASIGRDEADPTSLRRLGKRMVFRARRVWFPGESEVHLSSWKRSLCSSLGRTPPGFTLKAIACRLILAVASFPLSLSTRRKQKPAKQGSVLGNRLHALACVAIAL